MREHDPDPDRGPDAALPARIDAHVRRQARSWAAARRILWRFVRRPVSH